MTDDFKKLPKVYVGELKAGVAHIPLLFSNFGPVNKPDRVFLNQALHISGEKICEVVTNPRDADLFVLPHDYFSVSKDESYLKTFVALARENSKKLVIFDYSDFDKEIPISNAFIFRTSLYRFSRKPNEFALPPVVEDLGTNYGVSYREKSQIPVVGFVGWANLRNKKEYLKYIIKNLLVVFKSVISFNSKILVKRKGIYFRKKVLKSFEGFPGVKTNFIVRSSFSGHANDIQMDPKVARAEFVANVKESDFTLAPKGDGNYSLRFFDTLSLARLPILPDTETVLPLEEEINYDEFIVRVNYKDIKNTPRIVKKFYDAITNEEFLAKQKKAREVFASDLKQEVFLKRILSEIIEGKLSLH